MAGLKKPIGCKCGSTEFHREKNPEQWVCNKCSIIVISRKLKPQTGICRECGRSENDVPFDNHGNICKECKSAYNKQYSIDNHDKLLTQKKNYYDKNKQKIRKRSNAYWQSDWEPFLSDRFNSTKKTARQRINGKLRNFEFIITREFLYDLIKKQDYKCALSKMPLLHKWGDLRSASIDRIDSSKGYSPDNVQLVCKGINLMKGDHNDGEVIAFLSFIKSIDNV